MIAPADNCAGGPGQQILCGRNSLAGMPAWYVTANPQVNELIEIPGTSGAGGASIESYSGWVDFGDGRFGTALAGGHTDGTKNNVAIIDLMADAPSWAEVSPESSTHKYEVAYEDDGKPACSHIYYSTMWVPITNRLMRIGARYVSIGGNTSFGTVDGFNLSTNTWDPAGTYPSIPVGDLGCAYNPVLNKVLLGDRYYDPLTGAMTAISGTGMLPRAPWCWDSIRNRFFGMNHGDNQRSNLQLGLLAGTITGTTGADITIIDSAAKTQLLGEYPEYAGMDHDPINDFFLFYSGAPNIPYYNFASTAGHIYKVTPNNTANWPIELFSYTGITPDQTVASGINGKFTYVAALKGFVFMARKASNLYFLRTA